MSQNKVSETQKVQTVCIFKMYITWLHSLKWIISLSFDTYYLTKRDVFIRCKNISKSLPQIKQKIAFLKFSLINYYEVLQWKNRNFIHYVSLTIAGY